MLIDLSDAEVEAIRGALAQDAMTPEARTALEEHLGTGGGKPIQQTFASRGESPSVSMMTVSDLMDNNAGFEDSGWVYLTEMLEDGSYDDSDPGTVQCVYTVHDRSELYSQMKAWLESHPAEAAEHDLHLPTPPAGVKIATA